LFSLISLLVRRVLLALGGESVVRVVVAREKVSSISWKIVTLPLAKLASEAERRVRM
jgi:hypothetical protein